MGLIEYEPISSQNIQFVKDLLFLRNKTFPDYVEWKYGEKSPSGFRGIVALANREPIGCFGLVPKSLCLPNGSMLNAGWFADWFVVPQYRGHGIGKELLIKLQEGDYDLLLGHPGPPNAYQLCLDLGWKPIQFQSRRRLLLRGFDYYKHRTGGAVKATFHYLYYCIHAQIDKFSTVFTNASVFDPLIEVKTSDDYRKWIYSQPFTHDNRRQFGSWQKSESCVKYFDDELSTGEKRRRILISNIHNKDIHQARLFVSDAIEDDCTYIELFTTNRMEDIFWKKMGTVPVYETPVVYYSKNVILNNFEFQGFDRENWTYFAYPRTT